MKTFKVKVQFINSTGANYSPKHYDYLAFEDFKKGDLVVVETQYGPAVAEVVRRIRPSEANRANSYVICKVDTSDLENNKLKMAKIEMVKAEIDEEIRAMSYEQQVAKFAETNPALQGLLEELKKLS